MTSCLRRFVAFFLVLLSPFAFSSLLGEAMPASGAPGPTAAPAGSPAPGLAHAGAPKTNAPAVAIESDQVGAHAEPAPDSSAASEVPPVVSPVSSDAAPGASAEPAKPAEPAEPAKPAEPAEPAEPAVSTAKQQPTPSSLFPKREGVEPMKVVCIPVRDGIDEPILYVIRRGLKHAIEIKADVVVLDMNTPGGSLKTTFEILEALENFPGLTITYVNKEAMSAGAIISAGTHEIWFAPKAVIGAAAPVLSGGKDVEATMKLKLVSYLTARMRAISQGKGYRGQVISSMIESDEELRIGDVVIKPKGKLLSLTDEEAIALYGDPPQKLLGEGIARDLDSLLESKFGKGGYVIERVQATWAERLAAILNSLSGLLLGLGLLALFIEFKTPGFGVFGISGIALLAIFFISNSVAGLSGHEPLLLFLLGVILVFLELFFFPGVVIVAMTGVTLMFVSLLWSMADFWPNQPLVFTPDLFLQPMKDLGVGLLVALALGLLFARFMPSGWMWDRMIVAATVESSAQSGGSSPQAGSLIESLIGCSGVATTALRPSGQIEVDGKRYEARVEVGNIDPGEKVLVVAKQDFALIVERQSKEIL